MKTLLAVLLLILLALPVHAQNADEAIAAWERGDYRTALEIWQPLAERGDKNAQFGLVNLYTYGRGTPRDYKKAYLWLIIATSEEPAAGTRIRDYLAGFLTSEEQNEAEHRAREWLDQHPE
jgi:TPR repeat protein